MYFDIHGNFLQITYTVARRRIWVGKVREQVLDIYMPRGSQGLWYRNPPKVQTCWYAIMLCKGVRLTIHALDGVAHAQAKALQSNGTHATPLGQKLTVLPPKERL